MPVRHERQGAVAILTLDRPARAHAYDRELLDALVEGLDALGDAPVVVVESTGAGAFCAGADLGEVRSRTPLSSLELRSQRTFTRLARHPAVTIAAVHGAAVGGGLELALACDLRVAGPRARAWLPEPSLGILPAAGGTTRLARLVGVSRAKAVILGGEKVDAETGLGWGLWNRVAEDPRAAARAWAAEIAGRDPHAQQWAKQILDADESAAGLASERVVQSVLDGWRQRQG